VYKRNSVVTVNGIYFDFTRTLIYNWVVFWSSV